MEKDLIIDKWQKEANRLCNKAKYLDEPHKSNHINASELINEMLIDLRALAIKPTSEPLKALGLLGVVPCCNCGKNKAEYCEQCYDTESSFRECY